MTVFGVKNIGANFPGILKHAGVGSALHAIVKTIKQVVALVATAGKRMDA
jgi:hypothetical protein